VTAWASATVSVRDRVSAGSMTVFPPTIEIMCVRDRVSVGIKTTFAAVVETVSVKVNVSEIA